MRIDENDLIEEIDAHMRRCGGECGEWCVGTAKDSEGLLRGHRAPDADDRLIYREAYTLYAAAEAAERLAAGYGLRADPGSAPGRIVYAYRAARAGSRRRAGYDRHGNVSRGSAACSAGWLRLPDVWPNPSTSSPPTPEVEPAAREEEGRSGQLGRKERGAPKRWSALLSAATCRLLKM